MIPHIEVVGLMSKLDVIHEYAECDAEEADEKVEEIKQNIAELSEIYEKHGE